MDSSPACFMYDCSINGINARTRKRLVMIVSLTCPLRRPKREEYKLDIGQYLLFVTPAEGQR